MSAFDDPKMLKLLELLEKYNLALLFHMTPELGNYYGVYDEAGMPKLEYVLHKFPNLKIVAHLQPFWYEMTAHESSTPGERNAYPEGPVEKEGRVQELFRKYPNLYGDLSANSGGNAIMRDAEYGYGFLEEFKDKLMFGTDLYCVDQYFPLGDFLDSALKDNRINQETYNKVTRDNAIKIFELNK
jgi:predicted TIM-barrel fold metal-dependent hydrolase